MRSILLHIADDESLNARSQVALDLARAFDGHLSCLQALPYEYGVPGDFYGSFVAELAPVLREAANKLQAECERRLAAEDVRWSWIQLDGGALEHVLRASSLSDIVVVGSREPLTNSPSLLARDLATRMKTPMLLVPEHSKGLDCSGNAVVAWNGSAEASRALKGALPLLSRAKSVLLVSVKGEPDSRFDLPAIDGAEYLSRHGIECELAELEIGAGTVADVLTEVASHRHAAYLVMGAYGRPRFVETVLGGVTRELLNHPPLPILTSH